MSNSPLVTFTQISPNKTSPRRHKIDTITIHCTAGQGSVEAIGSIFADPSRQASSNYGIGSDGRIGMYVDEGDRAWCSSNSANDNRAVTIECSSDNFSPYAISDTVYKSLIELCVDICKRNGIKELKWKGDKTLIGNVEEQNMTVHRWFSNKECPGEYIYERLGKIAADVNSILSNETPAPIETPEINQNGVFEPYMVRVSIVNLNIRKGPGVDYPIVGYTGKGIFTIVEEKDGWGKLKSGAGWIRLEYTAKY